MYKNLVKINHVDDMWYYLNYTYFSYKYQMILLIFWWNYFTNCLNIYIEEKRWKIQKEAERGLKEAC